MQIKIVKYHCMPIKIQWLKSKKLKNETKSTAPNTNVEVEQQEVSFIAGRNAKQPLRKTAWLFHTELNSLTIWSSNHTPRYYSKDLKPYVLGANTRDPTHDKVMREKTWQARRIRFSGVSKRPAHEIPPMTRSWERKPDRQGRSSFQGFRKAAPGAHLKDDTCLSDACLNGLLPNFCDTGRRPSPISFQIRINLEL